MGAPRARSSRTGGEWAQHVGGPGGIWSSAWDAAQHVRIHVALCWGKEQNSEAPWGSLAWGQPRAQLIAPGGSWAALPAGGPRPAAEAPAMAAPRGIPDLPPLLHLPDLPRLPKPRSTLTRNDSVSINRKSPQCFILHKSQN